MNTITSEMVELAMRAWGQIARALADPPAPEVFPAEGGVLVLSWNDDVWDLTLMLRGGSDVAEWHYYDASADERRTGSWRLGTPVPPALADDLLRFRAA